VITKDPDRIGALILRDDDADEITARSAGGAARARF